MDSVRQLSAHSSSTKTTYAYQFSEYYDAPPYGKWNPLVSNILSWLKTSASHGEEISFVFGNMYNQEYGILKGALTLSLNATLLTSCWCYCLYLNFPAYTLYLVCIGVLA